MPLSLEETNLLIAVLGVEVPPVILEQKALEEKFNKREAEVAARSGEMQQRSDGAKLQALFNQAGIVAKGKDFSAALKFLDQVEAGLAMPDPADEYRKRAAEIGKRSGEMKQRGDGAKILELFGQAAAAAAANDFAAAEKLLDQVEAGLALPDPAEEFRKRAAEIGARSAEMKQRSDGVKLQALFDQATAAAAGNDFTAARQLLVQVETGLAAPDVVPEAAAADKLLPVWIEAKELVGTQISQLQSMLQATKLPLFMGIADKGLNSLTKQFQVGLQVALTEFDSASTPETKTKAKSALAGKVSDFRDFVESHPALPLLDENPFGVACTIRSTLATALDSIEKSLVA